MQAEKDAATAMLECCPQLEVLQATTTRDLGETEMGEGERGWEGAQVRGENHCDRDVHVRSGGEELKSLPHSIHQSVPIKSWTTVRCGAVRDGCSPGTRAVRQNRELGLAKARGWGPQGLGGDPWGTSDLSGR